MLDRELFMKIEEKIAFAEKRIQELQLLISAWQINSEEKNAPFLFECGKADASKKNLSIAA